MIKSMTGFSFVDVSTSRGKLVIELKSVNKKFLDFVAIIPEEFSRFEIAIRKLIAQHISRGLIVVRVGLFLDREKYLPSVPFLKELKKSWGKLVKELGMKKEEIDLKFLVRQAQEISLPGIRDVAFWEKPLMEGIKKALEELIRMKHSEGRELFQDIKKRLITIEKILLEVEKGAPKAILAYRKKLQKQVAEIMEISKDDERILKEVAIFAEKVDLTEEIVRLRSHIRQFNKLLVRSIGGIGRKMDFILQEMIREANTLAAKSADAKLSRQAVDIKGELEKIREQVQNIE